LPRLCRKADSLVSKVLLEALTDSALMVPWLFGIYLVVGFLEARVGERFRRRLAGSGQWGPLVGTLLGLFPQCGFSVVGAALYSQGLISVGTLVAVLLATSDEAIPVILSRPEHVAMLGPILLGKLVIAWLGGTATDWLFGKKRFAPESCGHDHEHAEEVGCCKHHVPGDAKKPSLFVHPFRHTLSVFLSTLGTSLLIGLGLHFLGQARLDALLLRGSLLQPLLMGLVGLIPNCAVSVALTQGLLEGHIGFGAAMAGLCSSGGLGLLVLVKESHRPWDVLRVVLTVYVIAVLGGLGLSFVGWG
jgi:hypothetical protein